MTFVYDQDGNAAALVASTREIGKLLNDAARFIQQNAQLGADLPGVKRKKFRKRSIRRWNSRIRTVDGEKTQAAFVANYDNLSVVYEFGGLWSPPLRILTNAVKRTGLRFEETPIPGSFDIENIAGSDSETSLSGGYEPQSSDTEADAPPDEEPKS